MIKCSFSIKISLLLFFCVSSAFAQETETVLLSEVVIQGELQQRTIQEAATSVAVETGEMLEGRAEQDLYSVFERTPNITNSGNNTGIAIRGINQQSVGVGGGSVVSFQVDGIALPGPQATFFGPYSRWDIEQVEILRGPQSTQQGRNALAGAVVVRSKDPIFDKEYKLRVGIGSRNTKELAFALNQPLGETFAFRLSGEKQKTDGWLDSPNFSGKLDERESQTVRAKLRWDPTSRLSITGSYVESSNYGSWAGGDESYYPKRYVNFSNESFRNGSDHMIAGLRAVWNINDVFTLESETTRFENDYTRKGDQDYIEQDLGSFNRNGEGTAFEQDLRLSFDNGGQRGVVGLFYGDSDFENPTKITSDASVYNITLEPGLRRLLAAQGFPQARIDATVPLLLFRSGEGGFDGSRNFGAASKNMAVFGEIEFEVPQVEGLSLTLGARYDRETTKNIHIESFVSDFSAYEARLLGLGIPAAQTAQIIGAIQSQTPQNIPWTETEGTFSAFLPKFSIGYDWTENFNTAFTVQRAYRAGGTGMNAAAARVYEYNPEFAWNYELSLRSTLPQSGLRLNANLFYMDWRDQQVRLNDQTPREEIVSVNLPDSYIVNAASSCVYGFEGTVEGAVTENLDIFASVGYAKSKFTDFIRGVESFKGNSFGQPEWTAAAGGTYSFKDNWSVSVDASYTGDAFLGAENDPETKRESRVLVNAEIAYKAANGIRVAVYARNLFDEDYIVNYRTVDGVLTAADRRFVEVGEPQTIGTYVQWDF